MQIYKSVGLRVGSLVAGGSKTGFAFGFSVGLRGAIIGDLLGIAIGFCDCSVGVGADETDGFADGLMNPSTDGLLEGIPFGDSLGIVLGIVLGLVLDIVLGALLGNGDGRGTLLIEGEADGKVRLSDAISSASINNLSKRNSSSSSAKIGIVDDSIVSTGPTSFKDFKAEGDSW